MPNLPPIYFLSLIVTAISLAVALYPGFPDLMRALMAFPAVGGFLNILYELYRDRRAHERALELQAKGQDFTLGAASHMAEKVFDHQVTFCERYLALVNTIARMLLEKGPTKDVMPLAWELDNLRKEHFFWLSQSTNERLYAFEKSLRSMAAEDEMSEMNLGEAERIAFHNAKYKHLFELNGWTPPNEGTTDVRISAILEHIKQIVGFEQLVTLRELALENAMKRLAVNK